VIRVDTSMALMLAGLLFGCPTSEPPEPDASTAAAALESTPSDRARAGSLIRTAHYQMRASTLEECSPPERDGREGGTRRVGVELWLEPTGTVQVPANPYYARLVDGQGDAYEATLGGCGPPLAPTLPTRGLPAQGWIVFDVPRTAHAFTLVYTPELVGAMKSELSIELGR
jgi:hypothetical protein